MAHIDLGNRKRGAMANAICQKLPQAVDAKSVPETVQAGASFLPAAMRYPAFEKDIPETVAGSALGIAAAMRRGKKVVAA